MPQADSYMIEGSGSGVWPRNPIDDDEDYDGGSGSGDGGGTSNFSFFVFSLKILYGNFLLRMFLVDWAKSSAKFVKVALCAN